MCNRALLLFGKLPQWNLHVNCHVNGTTFQSGLRSQTGLSSLRVSCKRALRYFWPVPPFYTPWKKNKNHLVFWYFQEVYEGNIDLKWVNTNYHLFTLHTLWDLPLTPILHNKVHMVAYRSSVRTVGPFVRKPAENTKHWHATVIRPASVRCCKHFFPEVVNKVIKLFSKIKASMFMIVASIKLNAPWSVFMTLANM